MQINFFQIKTDLIQKAFDIEDDFDEITGAKLFDLRRTITGYSMPEFSATFTRDGIDYVSQARYTLEHFYKKSVVDIINELVENAIVINVEKA